jgi:hypothetical protein
MIIFPINIILAYDYSYSIKNVGLMEWVGSPWTILKIIPKCQLAESNPFFSGIL